MNVYDPGTDLFISEFHKDKERPRGTRRTSWDVEGETREGGQVSIIKLSVDGQIVATHIYSGNHPDPIWNSGFLKDFLRDWLGIDPPK